tara:strand:+ start:10040 stop:10162 length:123 start_codon:yes stop_codon:yes gene_type:complete
MSNFPDIKNQKGTNKIKLVINCTDSLNYFDKIKRLENSND